MGQRLSCPSDNLIDIPNPLSPLYLLSPLSHFDMKLTKKQTEILSFVREHLNTHGYARSYREIAEEFDLSSPATVHQHVQALIEKGQLKASEDGEARSLEIVNASTSSDLLCTSIWLPLSGLLTPRDPI